MPMVTKTENTKSKIKNTKNETQSKKGSSVPFDPGFAPYVLSFMETYEYLNAEVRKFKNIVQRKMKYRSFEQPLFRLLNNITSFYFGGMLYGAYLSCYYSENPMEIEGNTFLGEKVDDIINIPVFEQALSAGRGQELQDRAEIMDWVALPSHLKKYSDNMAASYVRGDSMEPTLFDDDIILFDRFGYDGQDGIYVINYKGSGFVKRLQRGSNSVRIISDNKKYAEMTESAESEDFRVVGKVRYVVHKIQG